MGFEVPWKGVGVPWRGVWSTLKGGLEYLRGGLEYLGWGLEYLGGGLESSWQVWEGGDEVVHLKCPYAYRVPICIPTPLPFMIYENLHFLSP